MAIPKFKNQTGRELEIPSPNGSSFIVKNGEIVEGSYYQQYADIGLLTVTNSGTAIFTYPEQQTINLIDGAPTVNESATLHEVRLDVSSTAPVAYYLESVNPAATVTDETVTIASGAGYLARKLVTAGSIYYTPAGSVIQRGPDTAGVVKTALGGAPVYLDVDGETGAGLDDVTFAAANSDTAATYIIQITTGGATNPNVFKWSKDGGATWTAGVNCSTNYTALGSNHVWVKFGAAIGHTLGDNWTYTPYFTIRGASNSGLDDIKFNVPYTSSTPATYTVTIDGTGTPDTFKWRKNSGAWTETVNCSTSGTSLGSNEPTVIFGATTGHTAADTWTIHTHSVVTVTVTTGAVAVTGLADEDHSFTYAHAADNSWYYGTLTFKRS